MHAYSFRAARTERLRRACFAPLTCFHGYTTALHALEEVISTFLGYVAFISAAFPCIILPVFLAIAFGLCGGLANAYQETRGDRLWVAQDSRPKQAGVTSTKLFGQGNRIQTLFVITDDLDSGNLFASTAALTGLFALHEEILAVTSSKGSTMASLCVKNINGRCNTVGVLNFWGFSQNTYNSWLVSARSGGLGSLPDAATLGTVVSAERYPSGARVNRERYAKWSPKSANQAYARSTATKIYYITENSSDEDKLNDYRDWELQFIKMMQSKGKGIGNGYVDIGGGARVFFDADSSFDNELGRSVSGDVPLFSFVFVLISILTAIVLSGSHPTKFRVVLVVSGVSFTFLSIAAGYGAMSIIEVPMTTIVFILPFVLVGIGVDDMIVIVKAFDATKDATKRVPVATKENESEEEDTGKKTTYMAWFRAITGLPETIHRKNAKDAAAAASSSSSTVLVPLTIPERAEKALHMVGVSITLTTVTDLAAFMLGSITKLPSIEWFCYYACSCLIVNFTLVVTAFIAVLALDTYRVEYGGLPFFLGLCLRCKPANFCCVVCTAPNDEDGGDEDEDTGGDAKSMVTSCFTKPRCVKAKEGEGLRCICADLVENAKEESTTAAAVELVAPSAAVVATTSAAAAADDAADGAIEAEGSDDDDTTITVKMDDVSDETTTTVTIPPPPVCSSTWWLHKVICPLGLPFPLQPLSASERRRCRSDGCLPTIMRAIYAPAILNVPVGIALCFAFVGLGAFSAIGIANVGQGFDVIDLMPDKSYSRQFFIEGRKAFGWGPAFPINFITETLPYSKPATQLALRQMIIGTFTEVEAPCIRPNVIISSWLHDISTWGYATYPNDVTCTTFAGVPCASADATCHCAFAESAFYAKLDEFAALAQNKYHQENLAWSGGTWSAGTLIGSQITLSHASMDNSVQQVTCLTNIEKYVDAQESAVGGPVLPYTYSHVFWDQYRIVYPELLQNFGLSLIAIFFVSLLGLVHPSSVVIITVVVAFIDVDLLGFVHWWGHQVNSITTINLVMAIGLVVDYSMVRLTTQCLTVWWPQANSFSPLHLTFLSHNLSFQLVARHAQLWYSADPRSSVHHQRADAASPHSPRRTCAERAWSDGRLRSLGWLHNLRGRPSMQFCWKRSVSSLLPYVFRYHCVRTTSRPRSRPHSSLRLWCCRGPRGGGVGVAALA